MRLAFAIVSLFPGGGLQRDCLALARRVLRRGHEVTVFAARVEGALPDDIAVTMLRNGALTNHGRNRRFAADVAAAARPFDRLVGFDKLAGLDVLYCADPCFAARRGRGPSRLTPRYRVLADLERQCFGRGRKTRLILLSREQVEAYRSVYDTEQERITLIGPTIDVNRRQPGMRLDGTREAVRARLGIGPGAWVWLAIGAQVKTKGFDRIVDALLAFPAARLVVVGIEPASSDGAGLLRLAARRGCRERVQMLGFRADIPELMAAADLLVHPARTDTTGTVILEAIVNGLPVVTTAACGYAEHVVDADAGLVVAEPFRADAFQAALAAAGERARAAAWSDHAIKYGANQELYRGLDDASDIILA